MTASATDVTEGARLDYRAFWTTEAAAGWSADVERLAAAWLTPKVGTELDLAESTTHRAPDGKRVEVLHHATDSRRAMRITLDEDNRSGHFTTSLTSVERQGGSGWIALDVTSGAGVFVNRPRLAVDLLRTLALADGVPLTASARRVAQADASVALAAITAERRGPVLVAATDERLPFGAFGDLVDDLTVEVAGLAQVFVLSPEASAAFNAGLDPRWRTPAWTIRTYLPGVDLTTPAGARANRILGTGRLGTSTDRQLRKLLGVVVRDAINRRPAPRSWRAWQRTFTRLGTTALTQARQPAPTLPAPQVLAPASNDLERVRLTLGLADLSEASLLDLLDRATSGVDPEVHERTTARMLAFQEKAERLEDRLDEAQLTALIAVEDRDRAEAARADTERRVRYLTKALASVGHAALAYGAMPDDEDESEYLGDEPLSFADLAARMSTLADHGVVFTGDVKKMLDLAYLDSDGKILQRTWESLVTLAEYVRAKKSPEGFAGAVSKFLEDQPSGYRCYGANAHASTESGWTKSQYKGTRAFPVPTEVSPTQRADMFEHFKLGRVARLDPRLHYLDDTGGTRKVYVGYIGTHLVNSMTDT